MQLSIKEKADLDRRCTSKKQIDFLKSKRAERPI